MKAELARDLVVISGEFGRYPSSLEHLVRQIARHSRIIWIEVTGMRQPTLSWYDAKRAFFKMVRLLKGAAAIEVSRSQLPKNLHLVSPGFIPFPKSKVVQRFNERLLSRTLRIHLSRLGFGEFGIITNLPMVANAVASSEASWSIYYCPDEWSLWPGMNPKIIQPWEQKLLSIASSVLVSSSHLQRSKSLVNKPAKLLAHGVDTEHFGKALCRPTENRIAFFGMLDARIDQELVAKIARRFPNYQIDLIGPLQKQFRPECRERNISFVGPVNYQRLPDAIASAKVLILPYLLNDLTLNISPLKARECLATGKPLVAMALPDLIELEEVFRAENHHEFLIHLEKILLGNRPYDGTQVAAAMRPYSWASRARELTKEIHRLEAKGRWTDAKV